MMVSIELSNEPRRTEPDPPPDEQSGKSAELHDPGWPADRRTDRDGDLRLTAQMSRVEIPAPATNVR